MLERDEPEILDGSRAWPEAQAIFSTQGVPDLRARISRMVEASWYDTSVSEYEGAFCLIQSGSDLEYLVGDLLRVVYRQREVYVYCVGGAELTTDFALARRAYFALRDLAVDPITVIVQPILRDL